MTSDDMDLVREYAARQSEQAFEALVFRHVNLVYSSALRQANDPHLAEEITQAVFILLARKAGALGSGTILPSWLHRTACFVAADALKAGRRRAQREKEAHMQLLNEPESDVWQDISPLLDNAIAGLNEKDRHAIVLRYFQNKSLQEISAAIGVSEDAAKKRVNRALEKLQKFFSKRGVSSTTAAIAAAIYANSIQAAPAALAKTVSTVAIVKGATASTTTAALIKGTSKLMAWTKMKTAIGLGTGILLVAGATGVLVGSTNASTDDITRKLEQKFGGTIVWDKHINLPTVFVTKGLSLEESLDELSVEAGAYWTVDYAIYDSNRGLHRLLAVLHDGTELQSAGWTNLSSRSLEPMMQIVTYGGSGGMSMGPNSSSNHVGMVVVFNREASVIRDQKFREWYRRNRKAIQNGQNHEPPDNDVRMALKQAMQDGIADGVLMPERLLAEHQITSRINLTTPQAATAETAAQIAKGAHAKWTTIYTLRKAPVEGAGIKLIHQGMQTVYGESSTNRMSPQAILDQAGKRRFNLTDDELRAHERAVLELKQKTP
jgi:RNA polymerase sigma factor (sigma-70 family)